MGLDYDAWLEQPYQDECKATDDYDDACEVYNDTDSYWERLDEFLKDNPGLDEDAWRNSSDYESAVASYWEMINEPPPPPEEWPTLDRWQNR